jgi:RNA polymerase sigma factor (sigma-70 family)
MNAEQTALVEQHLDVVLWAIRRDFPHVSRAEMDDTIGDGYLGLIRAAELYDPDNGTSFPTFARQWIGNAIRQGRQRFDGDPRHNPDHERPLSFEIDIDDESARRFGERLTLGDVIEAPPLLVEPEPEITDERLRNAYAGADEITTALLDAVGDGCALNDAADRVGVTACAMRQRKSRLIRKVAAT